MNNQNYEDYMRSVLGYVPNTSNTYYNNSQSYMPEQVTENVIEEKTEWYPEIYKIVYPMVCKACDENQNSDITEDLIENMTNIVYTNIEVGDVEVKGNQSQTIQPELKNGDVVNPRAKIQQQRETRGPRPNNPILRDLIRILILREFFDRRRPPYHGRPGPRPPFHGGPGAGPIPPFPRYY